VCSLVEASPRRGIRRRPYNFSNAVRLGLMVSLALDPAHFERTAPANPPRDGVLERGSLLLTGEDKAELLRLVEQAQAKLNTERVQILTRTPCVSPDIYRRLNNPFVLGLLEAYWDAYEAVELNTYADYGTFRKSGRFTNGLHKRSKRRLRTGKTLLIQHMQLIDRMGVAHEYIAPQAVYP